jgi:hypothetical protein
LYLVYFSLIDILLASPIVYKDCVNDISTLWINALDLCFSLVHTLCFSAIVFHLVLLVQIFL